MNNIGKKIDEIKTVSLDSINLIVGYAQEITSEISKKIKEEENEISQLNRLIIGVRYNEHKKLIDLHSKAAKVENRIEKLKEAEKQLLVIDKALMTIANTSSNVKVENIFSLIEKYYNELCMIDTNLASLGIKVKNDKISKIDKALEKVKATSLVAIELMLNSAQEMNGIVSDKLTANKEETHKLENSIKEKLDNKDYGKVRTLSGKVVKITAKVRELETAEEKLSKMDKLLTAIVNNVSKVEIKNILNIINKYYGELCKVNVLLGNPVLKSNGIKKADQKVKEVLAALEVARKNLNYDDLNAAIKLVNALPDSKDKEDMKKEISKISDLIDNKTKFDRVKYLMDEAEKKVDKKLWLEAEKKISTLPDGTEKEELKVRLQKLDNENKDKVLKLLEELEKEIKDNNNVTMSKVEELCTRYDIMVSIYSSRAIDKKLEKRVKNIIMYSNVFVQEEKQKDEAINNPKKIGLKARFIEFFGLPVSAICRSKFYGKVLKTKIEKAKKENDIESVKKYEQRNNDRDIISGVRLYKSLDSLSKLNTKLYKNNGLDKFDGIRYNRVSNIAANKLASGLNRRLKKESDLILQDKKRTINVVNQAMEMLAIQDVEEYTGRFSKLRKLLNVKTNQEKYDERVCDLNDFLDEAQKANTLTPEEVLAYKEEIDNISFYKKVYTSGNSYKYTDTDIKDIMKNINSSLPYVKRV